MTLNLVRRERRGADASIATVAITAKGADSERWYTTVEALHEFLPPLLREEIRYGSNVSASSDKFFHSLIIALMSLWDSPVIQRIFLRVDL